MCFVQVFQEIGICVPSSSQVFYTLSEFSMIFMWFMSMGFDLVDLFDKWVYGFTNGGYLRFIYGGNLGVLSYIMW